MTNFFEGVKAKKHPPPEEKVDPVKAKRTIDALRKPPKSLPRTNYQRITNQTYLEAQLKDHGCRLEGGVNRRFKIIMI